MSHATATSPGRRGRLSGPLAVRALAAALLVGLGGPAWAPPAQAVEAVEAVEAGGSLTASDGRLRAGCHPYSFVYAVQVPYDDWMLETSVRDPGGRGVASHAFLGPYDPRSQRVTYRLCRGATRPGRFTITGRLVAYDDPAQGTRVDLPVETFRLRRR